jgi:hypothetical protein
VRDPGGEASVKDADERVALADFCTKKSPRAAAARFYGEAFTADAALADDHQHQGAGRVTESTR